MAEKELELEYINTHIQTKKNDGLIDANEISDGYHTFGELYEHRITLFIALCKVYAEEFPNGYDVFHTLPKDGWFILGLNKGKGEQITYHLPESKLKECEFAEQLEDGEYEFDGHTSSDVLERLKNL